MAQARISVFEVETGRETDTLTIDFEANADELLPESASYDACLGCGLCASGCPASGLHRWRPSQRGAATAIE